MNRHVKCVLLLLCLAIYESVCYTSCYYRGGGGGGGVGGGYGGYGRQRCSNGPPGASRNYDQLGRYDGHGGRHSKSSKHGQRDDGGGRPLDHWPGHKSTTPNQHHQNQQQNSGEATTTESMNDIERFLVGRRRKRNTPLWMNPNLYYNRGIGRSLSGNTNQESEEYEEEEESPYGYEIPESGRYSMNRHKHSRDSSRDPYSHHSHRHNHNYYNQQHQKGNPLFRHLKLV